MKILVVGAGALGGYFGGRLAAAGRDVTFLVREGRARQLRVTGGLVIKSPAGDLTLAEPALVRAQQVGGPYDLVLMACKAAALDSCMADAAPGVGPNTLILPLLNGMGHIDRLADRFGRDRVLGGRCFIFAGLDDDGRIMHQGDVHTIDFGELDGGESERVLRVRDALSGAGFTVTLNQNITNGMWEKWVMIATVAGSTCLMRATIGDIVRAGALSVSLSLLEECVAIAAANGQPVGDSYRKTILSIISNPDSTQSASMHKDMEKGLPIEADHIIGDLLDRVPAGWEGDVPVLELVYRHVKTYEVRREREGWK